MDLLQNTLNTLITHRNESEHNFDLRNSILITEESKLLIGICIVYFMRDYST